jgi:hypothetical protein
MKIADIAPFFATLQAANPEPETELEYTTPFELLAAVLLSAQATDVGVNKALARLWPLANTPQGLLDLGLEKVEASRTCWPPAASWSTSSAAKCRQAARPWNRYREWVAKPPTWY